MSLDYLKSQIDDLRTRAEKLNDAWIRADKQIDEDANLTAVGKQLEHQRQAESYTAQLKALRDKERTLISDKKKSLQRALFGLPPTASADPIQVVGYRDAQDRAARLDSDVDAQEMLGRAEVSGDTVLAAAVLSVAVGRWSKVVKHYIDEHPGAADKLNDLAELEQYDGFSAGAHYMAGPTRLF